MSKKIDIDISAMEIEQNLPHWLSEQERNRGKNEARRKAIREKHRRAHQAKRKAERILKK